MAHGGTDERSWVEVDLARIRANAAARVRVAGAAGLGAGATADGCGHGAGPVARAALAGGASALAVATLTEGEALRQAGIDAPILVFAPARPDLAQRYVAHRLLATV